MGFDIFGRLGLDTSEFTAGFRRASKETESFQYTMGKQIGGIAALVKSQLAGAFTGVGLVTATKQTIDYASKISDLSTKLGVGTESLQFFEHAAKLSGASLEDIGTAFKGLAKARNEAIGGDETKLKAFSNFGFDKAALQASNLESIFSRIAATFGNTDFGADELALVMEVLGKTGDTLLPAFKNGFAEAADSASQLGTALREDVIQALDEIGDDWDTLIERLRVPFASFVAFILKGIHAIVDGFDLIFGWMGAFAGGFQGTEGGFIAKVKGGWGQAQEHVDRIQDSWTAPEKERAVRDPKAAKMKKEEEEKFIREVVMTSKNVPFVTDALAKIGGVTSSVGLSDPALQVHKDSKEILKQIADNTKRAAVKRGSFA